jgi:hypothetical protein
MLSLTATLIGSVIISAALLLLAWADKMDEM